MSKKVLVFPYGIRLKEEGMIEVFPAAEVLIPDKRGEWLSLFFIIDSGATISALPKSDAEVFGVDVEAGSPLRLTGISGESLKCWRHLMTVRLGGIIMKLPIVFVESDESPRVLGRAGLFEHFLIIFDEKQRRSGLLKENSAEEKAVRIILDKIKLV